MSKTTDRIILNKTRSSTERWYLEGSTLVNGKTRYDIEDFFASDHPAKETVRGYLKDGGHESLIPVPGWTRVETSVEDNPLGQPISNDKPVGDMPWPQSVQDILDRPVGEQDTLMSAYFGTLNDAKGKGVTRKLRKALFAAGFRRLAALPAV